VRHSQGLVVRWKVWATNRGALETWEVVGQLSTPPWIKGSDDPVVYLAREWKRLFTSGFCFQT